MPDDPDDDDAGRRRAARRRRRLDEVFGEVVPEATRDESAGPASGPTRRRGSTDERDDELRRDVPPHHG
jgi:hypothetical protein